MVAYTLTMGCNSDSGDAIEFEKWRQEHESKIAALFNLYSTEVVVKKKKTNTKGITKQWASDSVHIITQIFQHRHPTGAKADCKSGSQYIIKQTKLTVWSKYA